MNTNERLIKIATATPVQLEAIDKVLTGSFTANSYKEDNRLVSISCAARLLAVGRNTVYKLIKTGRLDTVDLNGCKRITMRSIRQFIAGERPANEKTAGLIAASKARYAATKVNAMEGVSK